MRTFTVEAVVIRTSKYGEGDLLLHLYAPDRGKIEAIAWGCRKPNSTKRGGVQLLNYGLFLIRESKGYYHVEQCEARESYSHLKGDLPRLLYATYIAELLDQWTEPGYGQPALFQLFLYCLGLLEKGEVSPSLVARFFEAKLMKIEGYQPMLERCAGCGRPVKGEVYFSPTLGGVLDGECRRDDPQARPISPAALRLLRLLFRTEPGRLGRVPYSPAAGEEVKEIMEEYIGQRLERRIKSRRVLALVEKPPRGRKER